jgi:hypothetical protein
MISQKIIQFLQFTKFGNKKLVINIREKLIAPKLILCSHKNTTVLLSRV